MLYLVLGSHNDLLTEEKKFGTVANDVMLALPNSFSGLREKALSDNSTEREAVDWSYSSAGK